MTTVSIYLLMLGVVAVTNGLRRAVPFPLPLLQMLAGALLAWPLGIHVELEPDTFLLVFIPPLLFIDGWRIPKAEFRRHRRTILFLAFGLVVVSVLAVGFLLHALMPTLPFFVAFGIASALSPTDAVAVAGISGRTRVPPSLMHVLQGEALMNDASGLVCLRVAAAALATGAFSWSRAAGSLALVALGGLVVGGIIAWVVARLQRLVFGLRDDVPEARVLLIVTLPYAAYLAAEHLHVSGILAAATAGMVLPRLGMIDVNDRVGRRQSATVLDAVELALNGLIFVLLGLQLPGILAGTPKVAAAAGLRSWVPLTEAVLVASLGLFVARFTLAWLWIRGLRWVRERNGVKNPKFSKRIVLAMSLAGVRGAISLAAALILPAVVDGDNGPFPARDVAECIAAGVIIISLVAASVGLPLSLRGVEIPADDTKHERRASLRATLAIEAIAAVERAREAAKGEQRDEMAEAANDVLERYRSRAEGEEDEDAHHDELVRDLRLVALDAERRLLDRLWKEHEVDDALYRQTLREIDVLEEALVKPPASTTHGHG